MLYSRKYQISLALRFVVLSAINWSFVALEQLTSQFGYLNYKY